MLSRFFLPAVALLCASAATAGTVSIVDGDGPAFGAFDPLQDSFALDAGSFGVTAPLAFASGVFGNPGLSAANLSGSADDPTRIASDANVVVIQNYDNDDVDGTRPANWNASWNARTSLQAIAANTTGSRAGFFLYWNEGLGVNRLFATDDLADPNGSLQLLFADQSDTLTGVPGAFDLNLSDGDGARTDLFPEANANLAELGAYGAQNFTFVDQVAPVPLPAGLPLLLAGLGGFALLRRRQR